MEDALDRCAIFCTVDIPTWVTVAVPLTSQTQHLLHTARMYQTLEALLKATKERQVGSPSLFDEPLDTAEWLVLMTSKDIASIHHGLSSPVKQFTSAFVGMSISDVSAWFSENIRQPEVNGYMHGVFIVLEQEAVDNGICTIVSVGEEGCPTLRSDFTLALENAGLVDIDGTLQEGVMGAFSKSGWAMTKDNYKIAQNHGMFLDGMEVKINGFWSDFRDQY